MGKLGIGLYVKNSREAVALYQAAFDLKLGYHVLNEDGSYFHSELCDKGEEVLAVVEAGQAALAQNPVQLCMTLNDPVKVQQAFELLAREGKVSMAICELPWSDCAAEVIDKFGIRWYLSVPGHRPTEA